MNDKNHWFNVHLNVICEKCQHPIPLQSFEGNPTCEECGTVSDKSWLDALEFSAIKKVKQYKDGSTNLAGFMQIQMNYSAVENIACYHCHHVVKVPDTADLSDISCENCNHKIELIKIENHAAFKNLVFYIHKNKRYDTKGNIIAVRCASCGAPLQADNTKHEYNCNFCSTLNIIPPSLRAKKVLDDVYVGWNGKI